MTPVVITRIILDTHSLVSGVIFKVHLLRQLVAYAIDEIARLAVLAELATKVTIVHSTSVVTDSRDPKDNKYLALALDAQVATIVPGDADLRALNPRRGILIYGCPS